MANEVVDGYRDPAWPEGFVWSEAEGCPTYRGGDRVKATVPPHLERACELLWQAGHPRIAEALEKEVLDLLAEAIYPWEERSSNG